ncbi:four-carbon acid sugar kinase family protein [Nakamurella sp.]|uniref:four-carbon acid sugar kinase family protein n=1 Tax=Nakamurella sp. TaxID=1869182 RepID=UPI0037830001
MNTSRPTSPSEPAGPVPVEQLLAGRPPLLDVGDTVDEIHSGRRLVVLDDDPTGTQSIADLPVLTSWSVADLRWALRQPTTAFFVLTNTRSLAEADAAQRNREIVRALDEAARLEQVPYVLLSRGDSTLRGYYPLETDVLTEELGRTGVDVDGVLICPAYIEPGRVTVDSVHWMRTNEGMIPVADSEFARDASFGYHHSDLRDWVEEKTAGRIGRDQVATITLTDIREGGPDRVQQILSELTGGRPVVVDAADDADLRVVSLALVRAEAEGKTFVYRTGPSFVRARSGQTATPAIDAARLARITAAAGADNAAGADSADTGDAEDTRPAVTRGLIVVGSHVGLTTRQLDRLRAAGGIVELELDVPTLLDPATHDAHLADVVARAEELLRRNDSGSDVVIRTSRTLVTGGDAADSLVIARTVSAALVGTVRELVGRVRPSFVLAKGGITSSDTATEGLGIRRAWSRGTMLPGIVSLWEPAEGPARGIPYIVFAGNVGTDDALADVVATLRHT